MRLKSESSQTAKLSVKGLAEYSGHVYRCKIKKAGASAVYSNTVKLTVRPSITKQPESLELTEGQKAVFKVTASGTGLKYQWYIKLEGGSWKRSTLSSAKTAKLQLTTKAKHNGAQFRCKVTNSAGNSVTSKAVPLKLTVPKQTNVKLNTGWQYANESAIHSGTAVLYYAQTNRRGIVVGINAGHGTKGGSSVKTWCHPDHSPKVTGGTTAAGETKAYAVSSGMDFRDGTPEAKITLKVALYLKDMLLEEGFDVLMLRTGDDVQLDNVARTVICNNKADCHIAIHYDDDGYSYDKGAYFMSVPNALKSMKPVSANWKKHEALGHALIKGLKNTGYKVWDEGELDMDLTQTSYSTVPSVDIEMGNQCSSHTDSACKKAAKALLAGIKIYFDGK
ncbi:MAG: N-acetylmuramoyl-L-alanine amidase [Lachnospiraceae bacterium]|nr:N-acetylmuramoyl-L-alanine amidase [Lachnospiraceae bacterium]